MEKDKRGVITLTDEEKTGLTWKKSSRSDNSGPYCVEVAFVHDTTTQEVGAVALRNSRNPDGPINTFDPKEWEVFEQGVRDGEFTPPSA